MNNQPTEHKYLAILSADAALLDVGQVMWVSDLLLRDVFQSQEARDAWFLSIGCEALPSAHGTVAVRRMAAR